MSAAGWLFAGLLIAGTPPTELEDQFEKPHRVSSMIGGTPVVVIAGAERKTAELTRDWLKAIRGSLGKCRVFGLANLDGLPFFVPHGSVRSSVKENVPEVPVLLDWDNDFHEKLGFTKTFELRLYSAAGKPLGSASGEPTPSAVSAFNDVLAKGCKTSTTG
ncbi:MAG: hypothetical protein U1E65_08795 [Myxococcota bacterium]